MIPSNTPPDGDFVRYVERLTSTKVDPLVRQFMLTPASRDASVPGPAANPPGTAAPPDKAILESLAETPFMTHVKWVVGAWIATQLLARLVPGLGFLFIPALLAYAGWVLFKVNRDTSGALFRRVQQLTDAAAAGAATEIKKARQAEQKLPDENRRQNPRPAPVRQPSGLCNTWQRGARPARLPFRTADA